MNKQVNSLSNVNTGLNSDDDVKLVRKTVPVSNYRIVKNDNKVRIIKDSTMNNVKGPTIKKRFILQKSSSGIGSGGSCDNYDIESDSPIKINEHFIHKRSSEFSLPIVKNESKKPKNSDRLVTNNNQVIQSDNEILHNTLDDVNLSNILEKQNLPSTTTSKNVFDAFANYLNQSYTPEPNTSSLKLFDVCKDKNEDLFTSQFLNTQALDEVDTMLIKEPIVDSNTQPLKALDPILTKEPAVDEQDLNNVMPGIDKNNELKNDIAPELHAVTLEPENDLQHVEIKGLERRELKDVSAPLLMCFKDRLKAKEKSINQQILDRSVLFENEEVTKEYRNEVNQLFEQIESSIYAMGVDDSKIQVSDELLDIVFNDDTEPTVGEQINRAGGIENINLNTNINLSFGSVIKKALINNANKAQLEENKCNGLLNLTLLENKREFKNLGPFYGLPLKVKTLIKQYKGVEKLYDWQDECLKLPAIENRKNLIYALPTSGGKTLVAEILMFRELLCYKKNVIFILPYVSIVQEKVWAVSPFGVALDFLVEEYASNKGVYPPRKRRRKNSIYIATIEKALGIINSLIETNRLHELGLIVVDEFHLIGEEGRGPTLEACLAKIMFLKANIQIIGMSATIGNISELCKFLNADVYTKNFRPVELVEYVKCTNRMAKINSNFTNSEDLLVESKKVDFKYSESILKIDPDMLGGLVSEVIPEGSCLVFCATKKNCENVTTLLCKLSKPELKNYKNGEKTQILNALKDEGGILCKVLKKSIQYGIAYHHSGLTSDERRIIEEGFRAGIISVICCTSTLAAGVNLPARRVIIRSPYVGRNFINLSKYKQMVGRAGRTGLGEIGESILITQPQDMPKVVDLLMAPMNKAISSMHHMDGKGLRHLLLSCISLGIANTRAKLQEVTTYTLLAVQKDRLEVDTKKLTDKVISNLFKLGALKESCAKRKNNDIACSLPDVSVRMDTSSIIDTSITEVPKNPTKKTIVLSNSTKLVVSELGCAAIKGGLELSRAHLLYEDLTDAQTCIVLQGHLHLLYLVTPYETAEQIYPDKQIYYEILSKLKPHELAVARTIGINEAVAVKLLSNNPIKTVSERVLNRFYVTLMLYDLWNEMPVFEVSEKYQINRGIVQNLMTSAATFASNVVNFCEELQEFWAFSYLLKGMCQRLSHCCVKELVSLMELPAVKQSRAKQLYNAGFKTLQHIAKASPNELMDSIEFMSLRVANQLIAASKMLLLERVENLREEAEDVLDGVDVSK